MDYSLYEVIEYYYSYFYSEDGVDVSSATLDCNNQNAYCAEYTRDKSYLSDQDYFDYYNLNIHLCLDESATYCYED